ncbi:hypothetical protein [Halobellus sp. H-GB7]|uniref:hypothetical protein n=1 Tax=Halobellus sp. H-GB7 TaxID=3069756 RepID=UPI0027B840B8|nr:hypothetical protein [Halobellus sp. H-GB7]MDQ2053259.1 hypothetical protein [Halobellus sp. H-GB7]
MSNHKYSTDSSDRTTTTWETDTEHTLYEWTTKPFVGHRHCHEEVECRIRIEYYDDFGADIRWEAQSDDTAKFPDSWGLVEAVEIREYGARHTRHERARWL